MKHHDETIPVLMTPTSELDPLPAGPAGIEMTHNSIAIAQCFDVIFVNYGGCPLGNTPRKLFIESS